MGKKVFVADPKSYKILEGQEGIKDFHREFTEELNICGVDYSIIVNTARNANIIEKIQAGSILVVYNDSKTNEQLDELISEAYARKTDVYFVAMTEKVREPATTIAELKKKQSYDVREEIRCRSLTEDQYAVVAKSYARQIYALCHPTRFPDKPVIFLSHKRSDGEDITAKIHDRLSNPAMRTEAFRDVANVKFGQEAQGEIDKVMADTDVFVLLQTPELPESEWVLKELMFAITRHIPVLWVGLFGAEANALKYRPAGKPRLTFEDKNPSDEQIDGLVRDIVDEAEKIVLEKYSDIVGRVHGITRLLGDDIELKDPDKDLYRINVPRSGYTYPQRDIIQYVQMFGRTPHRADFVDLSKELSAVPEYDSAVILSDTIVHREIKKAECKIVEDSYDNFYSTWERYLNGEKEAKNMEIVISGAFPDNNEKYQHCLTDALILFEKEILAQGYELTFGAHPTFQELFYEIAKETCPENYKDKLNMYISDYFISKFGVDTSHFDEKFTWKVTDKADNDQEKSLTRLRKDMIERESVKALVCLGGKINTDTEKHEGIREEIDIALANNIPVFVVGSVGGCSSVVAKEYQKQGWNLLNDAGDSVNEMFMDGLDYREMAKALIKYIEK